MDAPPVVVKELASVLQQFVNVLPGVVEIQLMYARMMFVANDVEAAKTILHDALINNPTIGEVIVYISLFFLSSDTSMAGLLAVVPNRILRGEKFPDSQGALERSLSLDFKISYNPVYALMQARLASVFGNLPQARGILEALLESLIFKISSDKFFFFFFFSFSLVLLSQNSYTISHGNNAGRVLL